MSSYLLLPLGLLLLPLLLLIHIWNIQQRDWIQTSSSSRSIQNKREFPYRGRGPATDETVVAAATRLYPDLKTLPVNVKMTFARFGPVWRAIGDGYLVKADQARGCG